MCFNVASLAFLAGNGFLAEDGQKCLAHGSDLGDIVDSLLAIVAEPFGRPHQAFVLAGPVRLVQFVPRDALRGFDEVNSPVLDLGVKLSLGVLALSSDTTRGQIKAFVQDQVVRFLQGSFDGGDEIEILVDRGGGAQVGAFAICSRVSDARALCPSFVSLDTGEGAGMNAASRAGVFDGIDVTVSRGQQRRRAGCRGGRQDLPQGTEVRQQDFTVRRLHSEVDFVPTCI